MSESNSNYFYTRDYSTAELVRRLLALAWQFRLDCLLSLLLSLALLILALGGLQLLGVSIDVIRHALDPGQRVPVYPFHWNPPQPWTPLQIVTVLASAIVVQALLRALLTYQYNMLTARLTQGKIVPDLRARLYARLQRLSFRFFDQHGSSSIFNRVTGDVQNTRLFVDGVILQGLNMLLTLAVYFGFMWHIHAGLTVACLSVTVGLWWVTHYYSQRLRPAYLRNRELQDEMVLLFSESVRGMQTVKGFGAEPHQIRRFMEANRRVSDQQERIFRDLSLFTPATQWLSQLSLIILFAYGGWLYVHGQIPLGSGLVVFAGLLQQFNGQVANITTIANSVQQSFTAARRVFEVLDTPFEVENAPNAIVPSRVKGRIRFEGVSFSYLGRVERRWSRNVPLQEKRPTILPLPFGRGEGRGEGSFSGKPIIGRSPLSEIQSREGLLPSSSTIHNGHHTLEKISFEAEPGQVVGIFGMTGAGKSTLLGMIPRFYDPHEGRILADGQDLRALDLDAYRRNIGIVYQESFLFSNTVAANIAFGNPGATVEQIERAARLASAHEFIEALPEGYETVLGEAGVDLSGGQRQRLALARALLLEPGILLLDDPTASVDPKTEHEIVSALRHAMQGRTAFVVANRLSLLRRADVILVLDKGRLVQQGTHEQLTREAGPYRQAALLQLMDLEQENGATRQAAHIPSEAVSSSPVLL